MTWAHLLVLCEGNPPVAGEAITILMTPESEVVSNIWYFKMNTSPKRNILTVYVNAFLHGSLASALSVFIVPVWYQYQIPMYRSLRHWSGQITDNKDVDFAKLPMQENVVHIGKISKTLCHITHWGRDKMAAVSQTTHSNAFSWMKLLEFRLRFHWSLFQLTIFQHWFR